jgi:hypothetical protein
MSDDLDWFIEAAVQAAPQLTADQKHKLGAIIRPAYEDVLRDKTAAKAAPVVTVETEKAA